MRVLSPLSLHRNISDGTFCIVSIREPPAIFLPSPETIMQQYAHCSLRKNESKIVINWCTATSSLIVWQGAPGCLLSKKIAILRQLIVWTGLIVCLDRYETNGNVTICLRYIFESPSEHRFYWLNACEMLNFSWKIISSWFVDLQFYCIREFLSNSLLFLCFWLKLDRFMILFQMIFVLSCISQILIVFFSNVDPFRLP